MAAVSCASDAQITALASAATLAELNAQDAESGYTVLHRCLYGGRLRSALKLLAVRPDVDLTLRDHEGLTCLDLLNATMKLLRLFAQEPPSGSAVAQAPFSPERTQTSPQLRATAVDLLGRRSGRRSLVADLAASSSSMDALALAPAADAEDSDIRSRNSSDESDPRQHNDDSDEHSFLSKNAMLTSGPSLRSSISSPAPWPPATSVWTWGSNNNFVLGHAGTSDRTVPERLDLAAPICAARRGPVTLRALPLFDPQIQQVAISKYHLAILSRNRLFTHGFGPGGRLGLGHEDTTIRPTEVASLAGRVTSIAVGPDHSIAIDLDGDIWTWGSNEHAQLGYAVEATTRGQPRSLDPQIVPIKKAVFVAAAGSKFHTAAFTTQGTLYTWGTNTGQLGYQQAVQPTPRKVTSFPQQTILQIAATNNATAVLVATNEVFVFAEEKCSKVVFPPPSVPRIASIRLPPNVRAPRIAKIVSGNHQFAALMSNGDVFLWSPPEKQYRDSWQQINFPQRSPRLVWSVRTKHLAAKNVAIGIDSCIVINTDSGHVFVGTRRQQPLKEKTAIYVSPRVAAASSAPSLAKVSQNAQSTLFKYTKMSHLQHIVGVYANSGGAFAAMRSDRRPNQIVPNPSTLSMDMRRALYPPQRIGTPRINPVSASSLLSPTLLPSTVSITSPTLSAFSSQLPKFHSKQKQHIVPDVLTLPAPDTLAAHAESPSTDSHENSSDQRIWTGIDSGGEYDVEFFVEGGVRIPAHAIILSARSSFFRNAFIDNPSDMIDPTNLLSTSQSTPPLFMPSTTPTKSGKMSAGSKNQYPEIVVRVLGRSRDGIWAVSMPQVHPTTMTHMLEFMYTGRFRKVWDQSVVVLPGTVVPVATNDTVSGAANETTGAVDVTWSSSPLLSPVLMPVSLPGLDTTNISTPSKRSGRDRGSSITNPTQSNNQRDMFANRVQQEFTRLSKLFRLDETEILYASMDQGQQRSQNSGVAKYRSAMRRLLDTPFREALTDVVVQVDGSDAVELHRVVLISRCKFFDAILGSQSSWALSRCDGKPMVRLSHLRRDVFDVVVKWMYTGPVSASELFGSVDEWQDDDDDDQDELDFQVSRTSNRLDDDDYDNGKDMRPSVSVSTGSANLTTFITFVLDVLAAADELLLDQLKDLCGQVLGSIIDIRNATSLLEHADMYHAYKLKSACLDFICCNLETYLENRLLNDLDDVLVGDLERQLRNMQIRKIPYMLGPGGFYETLREKVAKAEEEAREKKRLDRERRQQRRQMLQQQQALEQGGTSVLVEMSSSVPIFVGSLDSSVASPQLFSPSESFSTSMRSPMAFSGSVGAANGFGGMSMSVSSTSSPKLDHLMASARQSSQMQRGVSGSMDRSMEHVPANSVVNDARLGTRPIDDDEESIFQLDLDVDASDNASIGSNLVPSPANASVTIGRTTATKSNARHSGSDRDGSSLDHGKSIRSTKNRGDASRAAPLSITTPATNSEAPWLNMTSPASSSTVSATPQSAWSPASRPQDTNSARKSRPSLREIMNEAREQSLLQQGSVANGGEAGRPPVPSPAKRSPALAPSTFVAASSTASPSASMLQSPFVVSEPTDVTIKIASRSNGKLSQKQRKQQQAQQAQQQQPSQASLPAWGSSPSNAPSNPWSVANDAPTQSSVSGASAVPIPAQRTVRSLRQIQEEEKLFRRSQIGKSPPSRASLLTPGVAGSERTPSQPRTPGWTGSGWSTPSPSMAASVPPPMLSTMSSLSLGPALSKGPSTSSLFSSANGPNVAGSSAIATPSKRAGLQGSSVVTADASSFPPLGQTHADSSLHRNAFLATGSSKMSSQSPTHTAQSTTRSISDRSQQQRRQNTVPVSLSTIQQEQQDASEARRRIMTKPLARIQIEERAMQELAEFYRATCAPETGEWIEITAQ